MNILKDMSKEELLEKGLIIGGNIAELEAQNIISFTTDFAWDDEMMILADLLIQEFEKNNTRYHYFTSFVQARLKELQEQFNDKPHGWLLDLIEKVGD